MPLIERFFPWLRRQTPKPLCWLGIPLLAYGWSVTGPFLFDDLHLILKCEDFAAGRRKSLDLFRFAPDDAAWQNLRSRGTWPWWSPEHKRIDFFRPLAEASFFLDVRLFGRNPLPPKLKSLAFFALALVLLNRLYRLTGADPAVAGLATLFLGISQTAAQPATFICNRADLFVLIGVSLAGGAYWSSLRRPHALQILVAAAGFSIALAAKEIALAWAGLLVAYELFSKWRGDFPRNPVRLTIVALTVLLAAAYLTHYAVSRPWQFGPNPDSGSHLSLLANTPRSAVLYLAVWTLGFPINILMGQKLTILVVVGAVAIALAAATLPSIIRILRSSPAGAFFAIWSLCFGGFACMTQPEVRAMFLATAGWSYLIATLLLQDSPHVSRERTDPAAISTPRPAPLWLRSILFTTNFSVSLIAGVVLVAFSNHVERQARDRTQSRLASLSPPLQDGQSLLILQPESFFENIAAGDRLEFLSGRHDVSAAFLTMPNPHVGFEIADNHTLVCRAAEGSLLDPAMLRLSLGPAWRPLTGHAFHLRDFTVEIGRVVGDAISELRFRFREPLNSPRLRFSPHELEQLAHHRGELN